MNNALAHPSSPLPLAGEGAEQSEAGGGSLRESRRRKSPHPNPPPQGGRGSDTAVSCYRGSHHDRDVLHAWHLELADLRRRPDGAGIARPRSLPVLARARRPPGRTAVVCDRSILADADPDVCDFRRRRGAAVASRGAEPTRRSAKAIRFSTSARTRWSGACSRWRNRSSTDQARCGSTIRSGASPVPMRRPAAASGSCRPTAPA